MPPSGQTTILLAAAGLFLAALGARAQDAACTMESMEAAPLAVIEPCTRLLERPGLSVTERAAALFVRGSAYHRTRRIELAGHDYDAALELTPDNAEIYVSRANVAFRQGRYDEGVGFLASAIGLNAQSVRALRTLGAINEHRNPDKALDLYTRALTLDPSEPYTLYFRSRLHVERQQYKLALQDADVLVAIKPDVINKKGYLDGEGRMRDFHVIALVHRAKIHAATGKFDLAERDLDDAVASRRSAEALTERAKYFAGRKRADIALRDFSTALAIEPDNVEALYGKGRVLAGFKRFRDALETFNHLLIISPQHEYALRMRALMHREFGETEQAVDDMITAMLINPWIIRVTVPSLQVAGYWRTNDIPKIVTPELRDAVHACMLDKAC